MSELETNVQKNMSKCKLSEEEKKLFEVETGLTLKVNNHRHQRFISRSQFQPFIHHPFQPQNSIQVQRISYLLKQYQSFNNLYSIKDEIKDLLVHQFILDGHIKSLSVDLKYKYNVGMYIGTVCIRHSVTKHNL